MKIKKRSQKIQEYNDKYPIRITDPYERVVQYFKDNNLDLQKACNKARIQAQKIIDSREYKSIRIILYEQPEATPRPRAFNAHIFSPGAADNKRYFMEALSSIKDTLKLISTPAELHIEAYLEMPANIPPYEIILFESKLLSPISKPDFDNFAKSYTDMLTGILTIDDDIFYRAEIEKYYSLLPRVEMRITYESKIESDYIYKKLKTRKIVKEGLKSGCVELNRL